MSIDNDINFSLFHSHQEEFMMHPPLPLHSRSFFYRCDPAAPSSFSSKSSCVQTCASNCIEPRTKMLYHCLMKRKNTTHIFCTLGLSKGVGGDFCRHFLAYDHMSVRGWREVSWSKSLVAPSCVISDVKTATCRQRHLHPCPQCRKTCRTSPSSKTALPCCSTSSKWLLSDLQRPGGDHRMMVRRASRVRSESGDTTVGFSVHSAHPVELWKAVKGRWGCVAFFCSLCT